MTEDIKLNVLDAKMPLLKFNDIKLSINVANNKKQILKGIDGELYENELICLIGESGAGKSTLLNTLSGRNDGLYTGNIQLLGNTASKTLYRNFTSYVTQEDILPYDLTPFETLYYTANLKLFYLSKEEIINKVDRVLEQVGLLKVKETIIGHPDKGNGLSGGEKRVNIANSLVSNPKILLIDEITTGLDSQTALKIVTLVYSIIKGSDKSKGIASICTIHQPSEEIFKLFDKIMILSQGKIVYFGPVNAVKSYFAAINYPCPSFRTNTADFLLELVIINNENDKLRVNKLIELFKKKNVHTNNDNNRISFKEQKVSPIYNISKIKEFYILCQRAFKMQLRHKMLTKIRFIQMIGLAIILGLLFININDNFQKNIQDRLGALYDYSN